MADDMSPSLQMTLADTTDGLDTLCKLYFYSKQKYFFRAELQKCGILYLTCDIHVFLS